LESKHNQACQKNEDKDQEITIHFDTIEELRRKVATLENNLNSS
jgi:hypothetical protein